jgi:hypothetical protein
LSKRPKYIDGIFNYCDRWCERCAFTQRCRSFAMEKGLRRESRRGKSKGEPPSSWETYDAVTEEIQPWLAAEHDKAVKKLDDDDERVRSEPLARRGEAYADAVDDWFERHPDAGRDPACADAAQVIRWYQHFIVVKLMRASHSSDFFEDEDEDDTDRDPEISDAIDQADRDDNNGSAKVALIGMDRSIAAWAVLGRARLGQADDLIRHLDALRRVTEQVFPNAREFIRPGLDWTE